MLAPYWALTDNYQSFINERISNVYYHVYTGLDNTPTSTKVLDQATRDVNKHYQQDLPTSFKASWVLVVTWSNLRHSNLNMYTRNLVTCFKIFLHISPEKIE